MNLEQQVHVAAGTGALEGRTSVMHLAQVLLCWVLSLKVVIRKNLYLSILSLAIEKKPSVIEQTVKGQVTTIYPALTQDGMCRLPPSLPACLPAEVKETNGLLCYKELKSPPPQKDKSV